MDFQLTPHPNGPGSITVQIVINYTSEEAAALTEFQMWDTTATLALSRPLTWRDFVDPGIRMNPVAPVYALHFQNRFKSVYGPELEWRMVPIVQNFRNRTHQELEAQRDTYFGARQIPHNPKKLLE